MQPSIDRHQRSSTMNEQPSLTIISNTHEPSLAITIPSLNHQLASIYWWNHHVNHPLIHFITNESSSNLSLAHALRHGPPGAHGRQAIEAVKDQVAPEAAQGMTPQQRAAGAPVEPRHRGAVMAPSQPMWRWIVGELIWTHIYNHWYWLSSYG